MARKRKEKEKITDPFERVRLKKLRAAQRREERKKRREEGGDTPRARRSKDDPPARAPAPDDMSWLTVTAAKAYAEKIMNGHRERPYWLSTPHALGDGNPPVAEFYPCSMFRTKERVFYGFLFREHRDLLCQRWDNATKEVTERVRRIAPHLV